MIALKNIMLGGTKMGLPKFFPIKLYSFRSIFQNAIFSDSDVDLTGVLELSPTCRVDPFSQMFFDAQLGTLVLDNLSSDRVTGCDGVFWSIKATSIKARNWSFPSSTTIGSMFNSARNLMSLDCSGSVFGANALCTGMFVNCQSLTDYFPHASGFATAVDFKQCPLSVDSAIRVMNALNTVSSETTCTLRQSMQSTYEASSDFVSARAAAVSRGWTISWAN